jgi:thioredoxin 1
MLNTRLPHVESAQQLTELITTHTNVMVCCGRMGPMCVPVYAAMEQLAPQYPHVELWDMEFDIPDAAAIRDLPECAGFMGLPFTIYYKDGQVAQATSSLQSKEQLTAILDSLFG